MSDTQMIEERLRSFLVVPHDADWQDVLSRADMSPAPHGSAAGRARLPRRRLALALVVVAALAVPALAVSGVLNSLFRFSNHGRPASKADLSQVSKALRLTGAKPGSLVQLASRAGWAFYAGRTDSGTVCYFEEPVTQNPEPGWKALANAGCTPASFPSPSQPVFNMSSYLDNKYIERLAGVAADGVASVQYSHSRIARLSPPRR